MKRTLLIHGVEHLLLAATERVPPGFEVLSDLEARWALGRESPVKPGDRVVRRARTRIIVHYEPREHEEVDLSSLAPPEEEVHWIEIEIVDKEGEPVVNTAVHIEFEDGRTRKGSTDAFGRVRVDDLPKGGDCWVTVPALDASAWDAGSAKDTKIEEPPYHWLELVLVDDEDRPVADTRCIVEVPGEDARELVSDDAGRIWVEGLESPGDVTVSFPKLDGDAWEVLDA